MINGMTWEMEDNDFGENKPEICGVGPLLCITDGTVSQGFNCRWPISSLEY